MTVRAKRNEPNASSGTNGGLISPKMFLEKVTAKNGKLINTKYAAPNQNHGVCSTKKSPAFAEREIQFIQFEDALGSTPVPMMCSRPNVKGHKSQKLFVALTDSPVKSVCSRSVSIAAPTSIAAKVGATPMNIITRNVGEVSLIASED